MWNVVIAYYWFDNQPQCPVCNKKAIQIQWGGTLTLVQIKQQTIKTREEAQ